VIFTRAISRLPWWTKPRENWWNDSFGPLGIGLDTGAPLAPPQLSFPLAPRAIPVLASADVSFLWHQLRLRMRKTK
jgi:hypothetical protein